MMGAVICSFKLIPTYIALVVPGVTVGIAQMTVEQFSIGKRSTANVTL